MLNIMQELLSDYYAIYIQFCTSNSLHVADNFYLIKNTPGVKRGSQELKQALLKLSEEEHTQSCNGETTELLAVAVEVPGSSTSCDDDTV